VLAWRLVNFWLPIPTGAVSYLTLKVPRGANLRDIRRALAEMTPWGSSSREPSAAAPESIPGPGDGDGPEVREGHAHEDGHGPTAETPAAGAPQDSHDARR
jgi:hypothetical protein